MPLEIFYERFGIYTTRGTEDDMSAFTSYGARLGAEFALSKEMALRFGANYMLLGIYNIDKTSGTVTSESKAMGSKDNPYMSQLGFSTGVGFKGTGNETNISLGFESLASQPKDDSYSENTKFVLKLLADIKFYL